MVKAPSTVLFDVFGGEFVTVITSASMTQSMDTEEGSASETRPIVVHGFVIDVDNKFIYLGETPDGADHAISIGKIVHISIFKEPTKESYLRELLEEVDLPDDPEKMN